MYNLFLDDIRYPKQVTWVDLPPVQWTIVRNYKSFVAIIERHGLPCIISFDHDLAHEDENKTKNFKERTGYDCAKFLFEYCMQQGVELPQYYIHSLNVVGRNNIAHLFASYHKLNNIE